MYEAKERQKFISNAQYLREMQHKVDSEYQACLRKQEQAKEQSEKKREQYARQELRQTSVSSMSAGRSYDRPWISRLPVNRQTSSDEASGYEAKSTIKSLGNKAEAKFPAIDKTSVKQKQKSSTSTKKPEKSGTGPKKDTSASQKPILSRRQRMNPKSLLENPDSHNAKKAEGRGKKTPILQGVAKISKGTDWQDGTGQRNGPVLKNKKKSHEGRSLLQTAKLSIDSKTLDRDLRKTPAKQSITYPVDPTVQVASGPSVSSDLNNSNLPPIKNSPVRSREDDFYAILGSNVEDAAGGDEDTKDTDSIEEEIISFDLSKPSLDQSNRVSGISLTQGEQHNCEMGVGADGRRTELSQRLLRPHNMVAESAADQPSLGQRNSRDPKKPYALEESILEEGHKKEGETLAFRARSPHSESRPGSATVDETNSNLNSTEDWSGANIYGRERQAFESGQRCYVGLANSARSAVSRPLRSTFNITGSLAQPANRTETLGSVDSATASGQVTEMNGSPRFTARRQLSPIRIRDSFSASESCHSASPTISTFEDSSLLEDSISNGLTSISPSTTSHDEDNFLNSHSSSSSTDSSHPSLFQANFTAHLHMAGPLTDQVPIFLTVSDLQNQSNFVSGTTACCSPNTKEIDKPGTDPEKLRKLQESLLAEDSEEEGDQCRICQIAGGSISNPLLEPCGCGGSLRFVHQECLKTWLKAKIKSGADLGAVITCELCKQSLIADLDDFNVNDYYRTHQQSQAQSELMNSGLYLVLLLHLYEQRFAELMRLNYNQASRDRLSRQPRTEENQNSANSGSSG